MILDRLARKLTRIRIPYDKSNVELSRGTACHFAPRQGAMRLHIDGVFYPPQHVALVTPVLLKDDARPSIRASEREQEVR